MKLNGERRGQLAVPVPDKQPVIPDCSSPVTTYLSAACGEGSREALAHNGVASACDIEPGGTHKRGACWRPLGVGTSGVTGEAA
jgi:hypothetical protein